MYGGGGLLSLLFWGAFAVIMLQVVQGVYRNMTGQHSAAQHGTACSRRVCLATCAIVCCILLHPLPLAGAAPVHPSSMCHADHPLGPPAHSAPQPIPTPLHFAPQLCRLRQSRCCFFLITCRR